MRDILTQIADTLTEMILKPQHEMRQQFQNLMQQAAVEQTAKS